MDFILLPKIELHLHLDCSLSYNVVKQLKPEVSYDEYQRDYIAPAKCTDLVDYISRAVKGIDLMQTKEQLRLVTLDLFEQLKADNVIYAELRFAPLLHIEKGLTPPEVVIAVNDAVTEGMEKTGILAGIILCTLRHYSESQSMGTVKLVEQFKGTNVAGFDIAADEAGFPIDNHIAAFTYAKTHGINCTAHAGEARGADSVWETLQHFHPSRIGHGIRCIEDPELISFMKKKGIHIEVCPTSNIQTNVYDTIADHTADTIYRSGLSMSINTDGRTVSPVTLTSEYQTMQRVFGWNKEHFLKCNLQAIEHAFTTDKIKAGLKEKIKKGFS
jgi:adenosine deaminase